MPLYLKLCFVHCTSQSLIFLKTSFTREICLLLFLCRVDRGSTVVKALCYKSEGRLFDPSWCQWILH